MKKLIFLLTAIFSFSYIHTYENLHDKEIENDWVSQEDPLYHPLSKYIRNTCVDESLWIELQPYFLPENHPIKATLDAIFSKNRVLLSKKTMRHAGFSVLKHPQRDIAIARHPDLKGYLVKAYLDNKKIDEWRWWKKRIDGARQIQECIDHYNFNALMKTPKKWIYPLPVEPSLPNLPGVKRKNFILVVEDMNILSRKENLNAYKHHMTPATLEALFIVLTENLLVDSIFPPNIPFCVDGKIAFLDTEHFNNTNRPMKLWKMFSYLSPEMREYWKLLIPQFHPATPPS